MARRGLACSALHMDDYQQKAILLYDMCGSHVQHTSHPLSQLSVTKSLAGAAEWAGGAPTYTGNA